MLNVACYSEEHLSSSDGEDNPLVAVPAVLLDHDNIEKILGTAIINCVVIFIPGSKASLCLFSVCAECFVVKVFLCLEVSIINSGCCRRHADHLAAVWVCAPLGHGAHTWWSEHQAVAAGGPVQAAQRPGAGAGGGGGDRALLHHYPRHHPGHSVSFLHVEL